MCYMTRQLLPSPSEGALIRAGRGGRRREPSAPLPVLAAERTPELGDPRLATDPRRLRAPGRGCRRAGGRAGSGFRLPHPMWRPGSGSDRDRGWEPAADRSVREASAVLRGVLLEGLLDVLFSFLRNASKKERET